MDLSAPGLENEIVRLEPITAEHWEIISDSDIEKSVWKWMPALPGGTNLRNYFDAIMKAQAAGLASTFLVFRQVDNAFAGITGFNDINKIHRRVRNALTWHPAEMATPELYQSGQLAMMKRAYDWRAKRLEWQINTKNSYMMEQILALGPTQEACFRNFERTADGVWIDKLVYSMTRSELGYAIQTIESRLFA